MFGGGPPGAYPPPSDPGGPAGLVPPVPDLLSDWLTKYERSLAEQLANQRHMAKDQLLRQQLAFQHCMSHQADHFKREVVPSLKQLVTLQSDPPELAAQTLANGVQLPGSMAASSMGLPSPSLMPADSMKATRDFNCGRGSHTWNKKSTTTFGRMFQYLRGHDLFNNHFYDEFQLNFKFSSPQELDATWKRYHPNGKQWRSLQNLALRRICRRHIYKDPPPLRAEETLQNVEYQTYAVNEGFQRAPELDSRDHSEIWAGFDNLGECHYHWSKESIKLWHDYELQLYMGTVQRTKKQVEKDVLRLDALIQDFIPTYNPQGYVMLLRDGSGPIIPAPHTISSSSAALATQPKPDTLSMMLLTNHYLSTMLAPPLGGPGLGGLPPGWPALSPDVGMVTQQVPRDGDPDQED